MKWKIPCNSNFYVTYIFGAYDRNLNITSDGRHHGTDLVIDDKQVISASNGKVIFAGWNNSGYGNLVMVQDGDYVLYYAHLKTINVKYGDIVNFTTKIGVQGATGHVTGEHLHFEVRKNNQVINSSDYMGIPNQCGYYNPRNYDIDSKTFVENVSSKKTLYLSKDVTKWRVYPLNVPAIIGNECGFLYPAKFGGLSYEILYMLDSNVAVIQTRDYGKVKIYCGNDTDCFIK